MWLWLAIKALAAGAWGIARSIPLKVWAVIAVIVLAWCAWGWHKHQVSDAAEAGHKAGYSAANAEWVALNQAAVIRQQIAYMHAETILWTELTAARKATDSKITQIQAKAKTLQDKLNAIKTADPVPAECRLSDDRVRWANCALGYTYACDGVR